MALKSGRVGVNPDQVDLHGRVKGLVPDSTYIKKSEAPGYDDILTQASASSTYLSQTSASSTYQTQSGMSSYQPLLVSGTNIKTINGNSLLGSGDLEIGGGGGGGDLSAYVKKSEAPGYGDILTQTSAASIYQTQSGMSAYQTVSGMSAYQTVSGMSDYQTVSGMSDYQTVSGMSDYVLKSDAVGYADILTQTSASSTYQTISGMADYQTVSGMSNYVAKADATGYDDILTETEASTLYQPILVSGTNIRTVNGKSLVASGNINTYYGIDSGNVIASPSSAYDFSYTATQDCWICGYHNATYANLVTIKIDGVTVTQYQATHSTGDAAKWGGIYFLKSGQVFRSYVGDSRRGEGYYTVYGVKR